MRRFLVSAVVFLVAIGFSSLEMYQLVYAGCQVKCWTADTQGITQVQSQQYGHFVWYAYSYSGTNENACNGAIETFCGTASGSCQNIDLEPPPTVTPGSEPIVGDGEFTTFTMDGYLYNTQSDGYHAIGLYVNDWSGTFWSAGLGMTIKKPL